MLALILFAQDAAQPGGGMWSFFVPIVGILLLMWFMMIRPAQRQERERRAMIAALRKNDKVIAAGGILGTVANVKENEDEVTLKVDDNVRIRVLRSSIVKVFRVEEPESKEQEPRKE